MSRYFATNAEVDALGLQKHTAALYVHLTAIADPGGWCPAGCIGRFFREIYPGYAAKHVIATVDILEDAGLVARLGSRFRVLPVREVRHGRR